MSSSFLPPSFTYATGYIRGFSGNMPGNVGRMDPRFLSSGEHVSIEMNFAAEEFEELLEIMKVMPQSLQNYTHLYNLRADDDIVTPVWEVIKAQARAVAKGDTTASVTVTTYVLSQSSFKEAVISIVGNYLATPLLPATQIRNIYEGAVSEKPELPSLWSLDILASVTRSTANTTPLNVLLFSRGNSHLNFDIVITITLIFI